MIAFPSNRSCPRCKGEMQYIILTSIPPQYKARCLYCGYEEGENAKRPQTNADRIRAMSDEELAELIGDNIDCAICKKEVFKTAECPGSIMIGEKKCYDVWLDWLRQEAET